MSIKKVLLSLFFVLVPPSQVPCPMSQVPSPKFLFFFSLLLFSLSFDTFDLLTCTFHHHFYFPTTTFTFHQHLLVVLLVFDFLDHHTHTLLFCLLVLKFEMNTLMFHQYSSLHLHYQIHHNNLVH